MPENERTFLSIEEAEQMMSDGDMVHAFRSGGFGLMGCDVAREKILAAFQSFPPERSGPMASSMGHGICFVDKQGACFVQTKEADHA